METPEDAINIPKIIAELQASFDDDRYGFQDVKFKEEGNHDQQMAEWREEITESWKFLVLNTAGLWDYVWGHSPDTPSSQLTEWLYRRNESPLLYCPVADFRHVIIDALPSLPREPEQFHLFMLSALAQGSNMWTYSECKDENELEKPTVK